ncbi:MAG: bifunctional adenosylcobinamide kinase/adenosylcobinamide-phosphate guanylyltransferase [Butyrivibrio sp.]|nr:bifunctional adenosylcobinamide kinase/adenosylcobinamide-phosphate guanylyltransferase [Muribaculum sp.]MCM1552108.1 bifunctional adenosylcobinamide kinase/adenosylcobinamide-phosphate guanylyltransferase [Butyrivibrio sp.]
MTLVIGKSGSGKSEYAEQLLLEMAEHKERYYIATMRIMDKDGEERVRRHRRKRQGKGFITIEQPRDVGLIAARLPEDSAVLLECITNLTANELFDSKQSAPDTLDEGIASAQRVVDKVLGDVSLMQGKFKTLVVVSGSYSDADDEYDEETKAYIRTLSLINDGIVRLAERVVEVTEGVPVVVRGIRV